MTRKYLLAKIGAESPQNRLVIDDQDAYDIMKQVSVKHKKCTDYYDRIADDFYSPYLVVTCRRLFDFCKQNIEYREESIGKQYTSAPQTILTRGYGDCKSYALFIGGVLDALRRQGENINWCYRFASEDFLSENPQPGHVFVVVDTGQGEIWIDPVLQNFNQDHEFASWQDRKVSTPVAVGKCGCGTSQSVGATTSQTGTAIIKVSAALAPIPVVGWIGSAAGAVIGGIISIVGSKWNQSPDIRWLIQLYEKYALGNPGATTDNHVNENDTQAAQAFFSVVTGVPIGGRKELNILQNGNGDTNTSVLQPATTRAQNYLAYKGLAGKIPLDQAIQAANIVASWNWMNNPAVGSWAGFTAAPSTIETEAAPSLYVDNTGSLTNAAGQAVATGNNKILILAAVAAVAFLLIK
jgi:hypothetical protein